MNQLTVIKQEDKLLVSSREVAEMIGKRHDHLLSDIRKYTEILDSQDFGSRNFFIPSVYTNEQNKLQPCFLLTRKGCDMVANKMTGEKGVLFTAAYVTQFEAMEKQLADPLAGLSPELKAIITVDRKVQAIEEKVAEVDAKVETQITLTQGEQRRIQKAVSTRVYELESDQGARKLLFNELYREIKDRWGVPSYRDLLRKDMLSVVRYIDAWQPRKVS